MYLADKTKLFTTLETSTTKIASDLKISQQTVSRKLREMENLGLITRKVDYEGHLITLTAKSLNLLKEHSRKIQTLLKNKKTSVTGTLVDGSGEGSYYISLRQYKEKIRQKLGFIAYPGTLNVKVREEDIIPFLNSLVPIKISGFKTKERTFGEIVCYKVRIRNIQAAIVVPERTRYGGILEIIAPFNIRNKLNLKTGDKVILSNKIMSLK